MNLERMKVNFEMGLMLTCSMVSDSFSPTMLKVGRGAHHEHHDDGKEGGIIKSL